MAEPTLSEPEAERDRLYEQLSRVGDFRRGPVSENWRRCGKPNCEARPAAGTPSPSVPEGEKGLSAALAAEWSAEVARLAGEAARALAPPGSRPRP